jgi:hypothetical protein
MFIGNIGAFLLAPFMMTSAFTGVSAESPAFDQAMVRASSQWERVMDAPRWSNSFFNRVAQAQTDEDELAVTEIDPTEGPTGTEVVLTGEGFTDDSIVRFGKGAIHDVVVNASGTTLAFTIPESMGRYCPEGRYCTQIAYEVEPGDYRVRVQDGGETSNRVWFEVTEDDGNGDDDLTIEKIDGPTALEVGAEGTWTVDVAGDFEGNLQYSVKWGDEGFSPMRLLGLSDDTQASATFTHTYDEPGTYAPEFTVTDEDGNEVTKASASVVVSDETDVHIASINPEKATIGTTVTLTGHGFDSDSTVTVGSTTAENTVVEDDETITFTVPKVSLDTEHMVVVKNDDGTSNTIGLMVIAEKGRVSVSGIDAPTRLLVGEDGTWTVDAMTNLSGNLSYSVIWGDEGSSMSARSALSENTQSSATFTHAYDEAGTYKPKFTVTDEQGHSASVSASVVVVGNDE